MLGFAVRRVRRFSCIVFCLTWCAILLFACLVALRGSGTLHDKLLQQEEIKGRLVELAFALADMDYNGGRVRLIWPSDITGTPEPENAYGLTIDKIPWRIDASRKDAAQVEDFFAQFVEWYNMRMTARAQCGGRS